MKKEKASESLLSSAFFFVVRRNPAIPATLCIDAAGAHGSVLCAAAIFGTGTANSQIYGIQYIA
ncbi:MAG: hypothetical protein KBS40_03080 [Bacteroidales bacterium]|nr:hypothetical protein [Bacteroidales bacterium]